MSVRAYNPQDNSPILLDDETAAEELLNGRAVLAPDQVVPVRTPNGTIERYRAADLPRLFSRPGFALDFVRGNQERFAQLATEENSQALREQYGAVGESLIAGAVSTINNAALGLPNESARAAEDRRLARATSSQPNQGALEAALAAGYDYDDALLLATSTYRRPTPIEANEQTSPLASTVGAAVGLVGSAVATAPVAIAAEGALAGRAAAGLARAGLGQTAAQVGGRVAAGAAVGATEALATGAARAVGEGIIRDRLPEFSGEEIMLLGGLGAVAGGGLNLLAATPQILRSRVAGGRAPVVAPILSNRDNIERLTGDISASLDPASTTKPQEMIVSLNQTISQVDPALNRSFFNPVKQDLANVPDAIHEASAAASAADITAVDDIARRIELEITDRTRREVAGSLAEVNANRAAAVEAGVVFGQEVDDTLVAAERLRDYARRFADGSSFSGQNVMVGRDSPIVNSLRSIGRRLDGFTSDLDDAVARFRTRSDEVTQAATARAEASATVDFAGQIRRFLPEIELTAAQERLLAEEADAFIDFLRQSGPRRILRLRNGQVDREAFAGADSAIRELWNLSVDRPDLPIRFEHPPVTNLDWRQFVAPEEAASLREAALGIQSRMAGYGEGLVNIQTDLSNLSRGVKFGAEKELADLADSALLSYDNFLGDELIFGARSRAAVDNLPRVRAIQSNRNLMLRTLGREGISELDRVERNLDPGKLARLSLRDSDNANIAERTIIRDYLRSVEDAANIPGVTANVDVPTLVGETASRMRSNVFDVGRAKADYKLLQLQGNQGGTLRGVAPSIMTALFGGFLATGQMVPAAAMATVLAMRPDKRVAASYALRGMREAYERTKTRLVTAIGNRLSLPSNTLSLSKQVARKVIVSTPALFDEETRDEEFDALVQNMAEDSGNPDALAATAETLGVNPTSNNGAETIAKMTVALEYLRQQMPPSLFDPLNPAPPSQRVSSMVKHNILRTVETIQDPLSVYDDFANGFVSTTKVQALRAVYPQLASEMNARVLAEYADRLTNGVRMSYASRVQASMLLGTPIEQALRQPNLARLQSSYAQTSAQAQAQGMARTPARAVTSLITSTSTEGASLQDLQ